MEIKARSRNTVQTSQVSGRDPVNEAIIAGPGSVLAVTWNEEPRREIRHSTVGCKAANSPAKCHSVVKILRQYLTMVKSWSKQFLPKCVQVFTGSFVPIILKYPELFKYIDFSEITLVAFDSCSI